MGICPWCETGILSPITETVYWELPDGTRAVEITDTPSVLCNYCDTKFQNDDTVKEIENQLFLIDTKLLAKQTTYAELLNMKRLLKRNYFNF